MADINLKTRIAVRSDLASKWAEANPALLKGEIGFETDTRKFKIGVDGIKKWNELKYSTVLPEELSVFVKTADLIEGGKIKSTFLPDIASSNIICLERDLATTDQKAITDEAGKNAASHGKGDIFIVTAKEGPKVHSINSYIVASAPTEATGAGVWNACKSLNGEVDANKVILKDNITLAGTYKTVGNIDIDSKTFNTKGMSVAAALQAIFTKKLQPSVTNPSVSGFKLEGAANVEVGTQVPNAQFSGAVFSPGKYTYGPATGVTATAWKVDRKTTVPSGSNFDKDSVATTQSGSDNNGGKGFVLGDFVGENVVSTLKYSITATYGDGAVALDNLGGTSDPQLKVNAGTTPPVYTQAYSCHRKYFYGQKSTQDPLTSDTIRGFKQSSGGYTNNTFTINVDASTKRVLIACEATKPGLIKVVNEDALNANITPEFEKNKKQIEVAGNNGYHPVQYNVWHFDLPWTGPAKLVVTLG